jgi:hypothetical protein
MQTVFAETKHVAQKGGVCKMYFHVNLKICYLIFEVEPLSIVPLTVEVEPLSIVPLWI